MDKLPFPHQPKGVSDETSRPHLPARRYVPPCAVVQQSRVPGERTTVHMRGHLESDIVSALRCPAVFSSYAFYVPYRLLWAGWEQFIADADSVAVIPTVNYATSPFAELGETGANTYTSMHRRALKLIYNEFFGDDAYGTHAFYTDFSLDTAQNSCLPLKTVNQFLSNLALDVDEPADNYTVAASTIELTEFRRRLKVNARGANQRIGGEKVCGCPAPVRR